MSSEGVSECEKTTKPFINEQSREIVFKVFNYFKSNSVKETTVKNALDKTSQATGVSISTIKRIVKEGNNSRKNSGEVKFLDPAKNRNKRSATVTALTQYQIRDIRNIICNFDKTENCRATVKILNNKIKEDLNIMVSDTSLRRILQKMTLWTNETTE